MILSAQDEHYWETKGADTFGEMINSSSSIDLFMYEKLLFLSFFDSWPIILNCNHEKVLGFWEVLVRANEVEHI